MNSKSLPVHDSPEIQKLGWIRTSDRYKAYSAVLAAEKYAQQRVDDASTIERNADRNSVWKMDELISARVAGRFLIEFEEKSALFNTTPVETLVRSFLSTPQNHDVIIDTGRNLRDNFIRLFRIVTIPDWLRLPYSSLPSFDNRASNRNKKKALARDGYRCIVTGLFDRTSLQKRPDLPDIEEVTRVAFVEIAQILRESTVRGMDPKSDIVSRDYGKAYDAASATSILQSFGLSTFADALGQRGGVRQVCNLVSLTLDFRAEFEHLVMWFELTDKPHRYRVCTRYRACMETIHTGFLGEDRNVEGAPTFVEFDSQNKDAPPPDPLLLALHALCARVANTSGAAELFDSIDEEMNGMETLAPDGSSLDQLLRPYSAVGA